MTRRARDLLRLARRYGWSCSRLASGHYALRGPAGGYVIASGTPRCSNDLPALAAQIRRAVRQSKEKAGSGMPVPPGLSARS
jgi:hypothetical protein